MINQFKLRYLYIHGDIKYKLQLPRLLLSHVTVYAIHIILVNSRFHQLHCDDKEYANTHHAHITQIACLKLANTDNLP